MPPRSVVRSTQNQSLIVEIPQKLNIASAEIPKSSELISGITLIDFKDLETKSFGIHRNTIVTGQGESPQAVLEAALNLGICHIIQKNNVVEINALETSKIILGDRDSFFRKPLVSIFAPEQIDTKDENEFLEFDCGFSKSVEKNQILEQLSSYLSSISNRKTLINDISLVADELFTNAIYNAPFVKNVRMQKSGAPRGQRSISMTEGGSGRLFVGRHKNLIVLGCEDSYGSLNLQSLINRILRCYQLGAGAVLERNPKGGAGIGSYLMFNVTNNFYALVRPGKKTLICCAFVAGPRESRRTSLSKSLHVRQYDEDLETA